jgi:uncharacterized protein YdeI (YjbR/CyaY-like superfamily)
VSKRNNTNPNVDSMLANAKNWQEEFVLLREIALACELTEALKWGQPCYTLGKANIVLIHGFKDYCALLFFKGALLADSKNILVQQTDNVQAARQIRFTSAAQIKKMKSTLKAYIDAAIAVEKAGLNVEFKQTNEFAVPEEFQQQLDATPGLKEAFEALTPGRQRGYLLHFSSAKQSKTRSSRIEKSIPLIFEGLGIND